MQSLSDVHSSLIGRGFVEAGPWEKGIYKYTGSLITTIGEFEILLTLRTFDKPPEIKLLKIPNSLKPISPHIGPSGSLCYSAAGSLAMDIFNPASQVLACIDRASEVLSQILEKKRINDLADEFFVYWHSENETVFLDTKNTNSQYVSLRGIETHLGNISSLILTDDPARSALKLKVFGLTISDAELSACIIQTKVNPMPLLNGENWPPKTLNELVKWQRGLDPDASKKILRRIKTLHDQSNSAALILISSPTAKYSAGVIFSDKNVRLKSRNHAKKILGSSKVVLMNTARIDDTYIVERNQPNRISLMNKKIALIGAGAIGGYLADLLVRSGAGLGAGRFVIIDKDRLETGNIGRHRLGFESLESNKADALTKQIKLSFPAAKIESVPRDVKTYLLQDFDLIINATGEQALSDWLSAELNQGKFVPILHTWIEGPGAAVRSLLQPTLGHACYRCLVDESRKTLYQTVVEPYEMKMAGHGCESLYVPFPATTAVFAASLAAAHILDWINNEGSPLLRSMIIHKDYHRYSDDQDPIKQAECPACHITSSGP